MVDPVERIREVYLQHVYVRLGKGGIFEGKFKQLSLHMGIVARAESRLAAA
jgi:hypothetical protein